MGSPACWASLRTLLHLLLGRFSPPKACCSGAECAQKRWRCSLHPCVGCVKLARLFRCFAVLWLLKLCGVFKARKDRLQGWHSVEVNVGGLSGCWHFGLSSKVVTQLSLLFMVAVQTALPCMLMVFPGWTYCSAALLRLPVYEEGFFAYCK